MIRATLPHKTFTFPVGEMQVNLDLTSQFKYQFTMASNNTLVPNYPINIEFVFQRNEELVELLLLADAITRTGRTLGALSLPYVPFSRQDRTNAPGESFSLAVFANLINSLNFQYVEIDDPHSDVTPALIDRCVVRAQAPLIMELMAYEMTRPYWLVSPDAGALKKTYHLAKLIRGLENSSMLCRNLQGVIESSKIRNTQTGEITGTVVHGDWGTSLGECVGHKYVIVDDIVDGGRTFIELAKALRLKGATDISLYATFGFFTKGMSVFQGVIDNIRVVHDFQREKP